MTDSSATFAPSDHAERPRKQFVLFRRASSEDREKLGGFGLSLARAVPPARLEGEDPHCSSNRSQSTAGGIRTYIAAQLAFPNVPTLTACVSWRLKIRAEASSTVSS